MGDCDYTTGVCACRPGYDGRACERFACPTRPMLRTNAHATDSTGVQFTSETNQAGDLVNVRGLAVQAKVGSGALSSSLPNAGSGQANVHLQSGKIPGLDPLCSGHGICRTMREAAYGFNGYSLITPPVFYNSWEADKVQGCLCDPGWDGYDCSFRQCPWGRDPQDPLIGTYKDELYTIACQADAGFFAIDIMGGHTAPIPYDADHVYLKRVLEGVTGVGTVDVVMQENSNGIPQLCGDSSVVTTTFTLRDHPGQLSLVRLNFLLDSSRFQKLSNTTLQEAAGDAIISMVTVYTLFCDVCTACHGKVNFMFGDSLSPAVDITATGAAAGIIAAIEGMPELISAGYPGLDVTVTMDPDAGDKICAAKNNTVVIKMHSTYGNIHGVQLVDGSFKESSAFVAQGFGGISMGLVWESSGGDGPLYECSNQGDCDRTTGVCRCFHKEQEDVTVHRSAASDGHGRPGFLGDCGHIVANLGCEYARNSTIYDICSGQGICKNDKCTCYDGFSGVDCNVRECPKGRAWFDEPTTATRAHALAECSGQGVCNHQTGECMCREGWTGEACAVKDCPMDATGEYCSGHGYCKSVNEIFGLYGLEYGLPPPSTQDLNHPETWDANMMHECLCAAKYSAGEFGHPLKSPTDPKDWVGRYPVGARPLPGWTGYACHQRLCPRGDAKMTANSLQEAGAQKEIQRVMCTLGSGYYTLTMFGQTTPQILYNDDAAAIKRAIEFTNVVGNVTVTMEHVSATACNAAHTAGTGVLIQFDTEGGNLALATVTSSTGSSVTIEGEQDGNSENMECGGPGLGLCDRDTGVCDCAYDRYSSDGAGGLGANGDCGHRPLISLV